MIAVDRICPARVSVAVVTSQRSGSTAQDCPAEPYASAPGVPQRARIDPPGRHSSTSQIMSSPSGTPHRTRWSMSAKAFQTAEVGWSMSAPRLIVAVIGPGEPEVGSFTEEHHLVSVGVGDREDASPSAWGGPVVLDPCSVHTLGQRVEVVDKIGRAHV